MCLALSHIYRLTLSALFRFRARTGLTVRPRGGRRARCWPCSHYRLVIKDRGPGSKPNFGAIAEMSKVPRASGRHSPRLSNARFGEEEKFFWDERANTLEEQSTMPIQDHVEMGFSGSNGDPDIDSLISKMEGLFYSKLLC